MDGVPLYGTVHGGAPLAQREEIFVSGLPMDAKALALDTNRLLSLLAGDERARLLPQFEVMKIAMKQMLAEPRQPFSHVYFPLDCVTSLVIELEDGGSVEVATVGREGMVGVPVLLGGEQSPTRIFAQVPGDAARMKASAFAEQLDATPQFARLLQRYAQSMMNQVSQTAACNHAHQIEQRLCRWLLMTHDRVGRDHFPLTQEFLAQMLGVRRPSVTVVAGTLQRAGLISYTRGQVTILNRAGLEAAACECYRLVRQEDEKLIPK